jgi:hypothetical protein
MVSNLVGATLYYDETNNIRIFRVKDRQNFNTIFNDHFVLGGILRDRQVDNMHIDSLKNALKLDKNVKEIKLKNLATGNFLDCMSSLKVNIFLKWLLENNLIVHYTCVNNFYYGIVDIVDTIIPDDDINEIYNLKNELFEVCFYEKDKIIELFYKYEYPNLKKETFKCFIKEISTIIKDTDLNRYLYKNANDFREVLDHIVSLLSNFGDKDDILLTHNKDFVLHDTGTYASFYMERPMFFKDCEHIFDREVSIEDYIKSYNKEYGVNNIMFVDSTSDIFVQISDVIVGILGKFFNMIGERGRYQYIGNEFTKVNIELFKQLIKRSHEVNDRLTNHLVSLNEYTAINNFIYDTNIGR